MNLPCSFATMHRRKFLRGTGSMPPGAGIQFADRDGLTKSSPVSKRAAAVCGRSSMRLCRARLSSANSWDFSLRKATIPLFLPGTRPPTPESSLTVRLTCHTARTSSSGGRWHRRSCGRAKRPGRSGEARRGRCQRRGRPGHTASRSRVGHPASLAPHERRRRRRGRRQATSPSGGFWLSELMLGSPIQVYAPVARRRELCRSESLGGAQEYQDLLLALAAGPEVSLLASQVRTMAEVVTPWAADHGAAVSLWDFSLPAVRATGRHPVGGIACIECEVHCAATVSMGAAHWCDDHANGVRRGWMHPLPTTELPPVR